ncbi:NAD(P)-dependent oxidoreductase [Ramlibacter sp. MMS24-I3-19]|uniref:NAD(P)-dependent oxidoreductase n=1 Tax=Ramlibacter sp. MMS24-I3-19 TaxID=3416606 RepID=UPI003D082A2F
MARLDVATGGHRMQIGFVGLGAMGSAMAGRLLAAGHAVHVFNRTAQRAESLRAQGASVAATPAEATAQAQVVVTMVSDDAALGQVTFGKDGIASALRDDAVHVGMSTIGVDAARQVASRHRAQRQRYVSVPVFGRPDAAAQGKLFLMAAGADADLQAVSPLLGQLGQSTHTIGPEPWQANLVKLLGNFMLMSMVETLAETAVVADKAGIEPARVVEALTGTLFNAPPYRNYGASIAAQRFRPAGFGLPLAQKDNRLLLAAADALGVPLPVASLLHDRFLGVRARGIGEGHDLSALAVGALADAGLRWKDG